MFKKKKLSNKLKKTRDSIKTSRLYLQIVDRGTWAAGNASVLMESVTSTISTGFCVLSGRNAGVDVAHALEDYACPDYKCLALDTVATVCDLTGGICSLLPGSKTKKVFTVVTSTSYFCRTLRNKCKESNILGCV